MSGQSAAAGDYSHCPRLANVDGQLFTDHSLLDAGSVLVALPTILVFLLLQRHFIAGLTLGSSKG
jgi:multiple sugar transport system permease protein